MSLDLALDMNYSDLDQFSPEHLKYWQKQIVDQIFNRPDKQKEISDFFS